MISSETKKVLDKIMGNLRTLTDNYINMNVLNTEGNKEVLRKTLESSLKEKLPYFSDIFMVVSNTDPTCKGSSAYQIIDKRNQEVLCVGEVISRHKIYHRDVERLNKVSTKVDEVTKHFLGGVNDIENRCYFKFSLLSVFREFFKDFDNHFEISVKQDIEKTVVNIDIIDNDTDKIISVKEMLIKYPHLYIEG